jgi:hypothetical protein
MGCIVGAAVGFGPLLRQQANPDVRVAIALGAMVAVFFSLRFVMNSSGSSKGYTADLQSVHKYLHRKAS